MVILEHPEHKRLHTLFVDELLFATNIVQRMRHLCFDHCKHDLLATLQASASPLSRLLCNKLARLQQNDSMGTIILFVLKINDFSTLLCKHSISKTRALDQWQIQGSRGDYLHSLKIYLSIWLMLQALINILWYFCIKILNMQLASVSFSRSQI